MGHFWSPSWCPPWQSAGATPPGKHDHWPAGAGTGSRELWDRNGRRRARRSVRPGIAITRLTWEAILPNAGCVPCIGGGGTAGVAPSATGEPPMRAASIPAPLTLRFP